MSGAVLVGPLALMVEVERLESIRLCVEVTHSTSGLAGLLRLTEVGVLEKVDTVESRVVREVWVGVGVGKVVVVLRAVPQGASEGWAVLETDVVCEV